MEMFNPCSPLGFGGGVPSFIIELSIDSTGVLVGSWLFRMHNFMCLVSFGCMLGVNVEV